MSESEPRPSAVTAGFWLLVIGAAVLFLGGLMAATVSFETLRQAAPATVTDDEVRAYGRLSRGVGILFAVAAAGLTALAVRARRRDPRFRRAVMALGLAITVLVAVASVFAGTHILALLSLLPIIVGTLLLSRPPVVEWYAGE